MDDMNALYWVTITVSIAYAYTLFHRAVVAPARDVVNVGAPGMAQAFAATASPQ